MNNLCSYSIQFVCHKPGVKDPEIITLMSDNVKKMVNLMDLGLRHEKQIELLQKVQDEVLKLQSPQLCHETQTCPKCHRKLQRKGYKKSEFNSVFTDHKVLVPQKRCLNCKWQHTPSIHSKFGTSMHPDLAKLQCEIGAEHSYRSAQKILNLQSFKHRSVNNHEGISQVIQAVGDNITKSKLQESIKGIDQAAALIMQIDGGHLKDKNPDKQSFEAMGAVVYKQENIEYTEKMSRGTLKSKHCSASALSDKQSYMFQATLIAAQKEGLHKDTWVTAICDGARNCWDIVETISPYCRGITKILDWFHISMKFQTISLPTLDKIILEKAKMHLWRGNVDFALTRLSQLVSSLKSQKIIKRINKIIIYITNNRSNIVDYQKRKNNGLVFTSHLAESTVESLINQRCKGKQHMRWTRDGVHPLLQIRAFIASNDWSTDWQSKINGAMAK